MQDMTFHFKASSHLPVDRLLVVSPLPSVLMHPLIEQCFQPVVAEDCNSIYPLRFLLELYILPQKKISKPPPLDFKNSAVISSDLVSFCEKIKHFLCIVDGNGKKHHEKNSIHHVSGGGDFGSNNHLNHVNMRNHCLGSQYKVQRLDKFQNLYSNEATSFYVEICLTENDLEDKLHSASQRFCKSLFKKFLGQYPIMSNLQSKNYPWFKQFVVKKLCNKALCPNSFLSLPFLGQFIWIYISDIYIIDDNIEQQHQHYKSKKKLAQNQFIYIENVHVNHFDIELMDSTNFQRVFFKQNDTLDSIPRQIMSQNSLEYESNLEIASREIFNQNTLIAGYHTQVENLISKINLILSSHIELVEKHNSSPNKYIKYPNKIFAVHGPSGTGKTYIARKLKEYYTCLNTKIKGQMKIIYLDGHQILSTLERQSLRLQDLIDEGVGNYPRLLLIDDFDILAESTTNDIKSDKGQTITKKAIISSLNELFDMIHGSKKISSMGFSESEKSIQNDNLSVVLFIRDIDALDSSLRRNMKIDEEIELAIPNEKQRFDILHQFVSELTTNAEQKKIESPILDLIEKVSRFTPSFVARDLKRLFRNALFHSSNRTKEDDGFLCWSDFEYALRTVKPSEIQELHSSISSSISLGSFNNDGLTWDQIPGFVGIKKKCEEIIYWPLRYPNSFERMNLPQSSGLLLYGPSGCGKSFLVKSLASLGRMNYISIKCPELFSKYTGETEYLIRTIFKKAKQLSPCVLVFDEIDSITTRRDMSESGSSDSGSSRRVLSQLLNEMDGIQNRKSVFIVACTNRIDMIDDAIKRPGRLDQLVKVDYPSEIDAKQILLYMTNNMPVVDPSHVIDYCISQMQFTPTSLSSTPDKTLHRFTTSDIIALCREAALEALRENISSNVIQLNHFQKAFKKRVYP